jgi:hypothetical protein
MATGILYAHSGWRWIVLLMLVLTIVKALIGTFSKGRWGTFDEWLNRLTPIVIDIQFLLGIILWILLNGWTGALGIGSWEHPITMIIGVALTHITSRRVKQAPTDAAKYQTATIGYIIAVLVIILGVIRVPKMV